MAEFDARAAADRLMRLQEDRPLVDRATFLPIGQYEDGSLTFAWPGFLKDAWEGGLRSYLDAGHVPVPDAAPGTRWSSDLDAFNAASIAPMAGVGMRAAGMAAERAAPEAIHATGQPIRASGFRGAGNADIPTREYWASSSPEVANSYTGVDMMKARNYQVAIPRRFEAPNVSPVDIEFSNPLVVGGPGKSFDWGSVPFEGRTVHADELVGIATDRGHDGLVLQNVTDGMWGAVPPATSYAALRPGTVRSATTGELLFANDSRAALPYLMFPQGQERQ